MKKKEPFVPITLTQEEQELLSEACSYARDAYCNRAKFECERCKRKDLCEMLCDLELRLKDQ